MAYVGNTPSDRSCPAPTRVFAQVIAGFRSMRRSADPAHDPASQETPARPFTRFVAIGDSFTEGLFDPKPDQTNAYVGWADRLAGHLARCASEDDRSFGYANLAVRGRLLDLSLIHISEPTRRTP